MVAKAVESFRDRVSRLRSGWTELQADPEYLRRQQESDEARADHERWLRKDRLMSMDIPLIHALDILESRFPPNPADEHLAAFDDSLKTVLILSGGVGTTKTSAACNWLNRHGGRFIHVHDLAHMSTFEDDWNAIKRASHLVIDDLGCEIASKSEWVIGKVQEVIASRVADAKPLVITTNMSKSAFVARYGNDGSRLVDRLKQAGEWWEVPLFTSQRKPEGK